MVVSKRMRQDAVVRIRRFYQPVKIAARGLSRMPRSITMPP
jgi:hypothetical protein